MRKHLGQGGEENLTGRTSKPVKAWPPRIGNVVHLHGPAPSELAFEMGAFRSRRSRNSAHPAGFRQADQFATDRRGPGMRGETSVLSATAQPARMFPHGNRHLVDRRRDEQRRLPISKV